MAADFNPERLAGHAFKRPSVSRGSPELELGVAGRAKLQQIVVSPIVQFKAGHRLGVAAIEAFGEAQYRGERPNSATRPTIESGKPFMPSFRRRLSMIPRYKRNCLNLIRLEASKVAILDEVVRMLVVPFVADMDTDVVQDRRILQPLPLLVRQAMDAAGLIEQRQGETRDLLRVLGPELAPIGELEDAATPHVGIAVCLCDFLSMSRDVVKNETFTQREIAQRNLLGTKASQHLVEQDGSGDDEVGSTWFQSWNLKAFPELERDEVFADAVKLFCRDAPISERSARASSLAGGHD